MTTPSERVDRACDPASVFDPAGGAIGRLTPLGSYTANDVASGATTTVPGCGPWFPNDGPLTYVVPSELEPGPYELCLSDRREAAGCGTFTVLAPEPVGDAMAGLVVPEFDAPSLDDVPYLLPTIEVTDTGDVFRTEGAGERNQTPSYQQTLLADDSILIVTTWFDQRGALNHDDADVPVDADGWDGAWVTDTAPGTTAVQLVDHEYGSADVRVHGPVTAVPDSGERVLEIARRLVADVDGAGWTIDAAAPSGAPWVPVSEGWDEGTAGRTVRWDDDGFDVELTVSSGAASVISLPLTSELTSVEPVAFEQASGDEVVAIGWPEPRIGSVSWSPEPGLVVVLGVRADPAVDDDPYATALRIATSIDEVDQATWEAAGLPDPASDGCNSIYC